MRNLTASHQTAMDYRVLTTNVTYLTSKILTIVISLQIIISVRTSASGNLHIHRACLTVPPSYIKRGKQLNLLPGFVLQSLTVRSVEALSISPPASTSVLTPEC
jgi:hypothetical protein